MDVIRSNYSTLSSIAQNEAPVVSEYPYTDLVDSYKLVTKDDEGKNAWPNQFSNYTSRFQQALRHFFGDYFEDSDDEETAHDMAQRWVAFARSGNPNYLESKVVWNPWRFIPHSIDLNSVDEENLHWGKDDDRDLFNIWRDVEKNVLQDLDEDDVSIINEDEDYVLESKIGKVFRKRALEVLNMEVVEEDSLRTELKRNKPPYGSINGDTPLGALRLYLSRWNITSGGSSSDDSNESRVNYDMIQKIQQMAQDMGVLGRGLDGDYKRLLGVATSRSDSDGAFFSHGYWDDDFFPQFIELQSPPEGRLVERDCTCDFWERIRCEYTYNISLLIVRFLFLKLITFTLFLSANKSFLLYHCDFESLWRPRSLLIQHLFRRQQRPYSSSTQILYNSNHFWIHQTI